MESNLLNEATAFAARAHAGQFRKGTQTPYIVHPMEAAAICASFTDDEEVLAAAVLHDVVEDAGVAPGEIAGLFGGRVASIVASDSEDKREGQPASETWRIRKEESIACTASAEDIGVRMVCLGDKLSNIRAIQRDHERLGDGLWARFNQKNPAEHAWYYSAVADVLEGDLGDTDAWREYKKRVREVFGGGAPAFAYLLATNNMPIDEECVVLRRARATAPQRFSYADDAWVDDWDAWWRHVLNDNSHEDISEKEAFDIIRKFGGRIEGG